MNPLKPLDMEVINQYNEIKPFKFEEKTQLEGIYVGSARSPYRDHEKGKTIWFMHHIVFVPGDTEQDHGTLVSIRGDNRLDKLMEDLDPVARSMKGLKVIIAYAGGRKKVSRNGKEYTEHRWTVRTALPWAEKEAQDYSNYGEPGYSDDIPF